MSLVSKADLRISVELSLPKDAATWVIAYLAKRGAGKTYNASVQAEEMLKNHIPIVVIDGMSIWWGLRVSADGKGEGLVTQDGFGQIIASRTEEEIFAALGISFVEPKDREVRSKK